MQHSRVMMERPLLTLLRKKGVDHKGRVWSGVWGDRETGRQGRWPIGGGRVLFSRHCIHSPFLLLQLPGFPGS